MPGIVQQDRLIIEVESRILFSVQHELFQALVKEMVALGRPFLQAQMIVEGVGLLVLQPSD